MRFVTTILLFATLLTLLAGAALASLPDPPLCIWEECLGRSPVNGIADPSAQYVFVGELRDLHNMPVANFPAAQVELTINLPCAHPVMLNPDGPSDPNGTIVWGVDTLNQGGGACEGSAVVEIRILGALFATLDDVRSPDEDGDHFVALSDLQAWQVAFVDQTPTYIGDLDCDGFIALSDLSLWQKHFTAE